MSETLSKQETLEKAVQKAIDGGWKAPSLLLALYQHPSSEKIKGQNVEMIRGMITSHDFTMAVWGEGKVCEYDGHDMSDHTIYCKEGESDTTFPCGGEASRYPRWKVRLQQMVIAEDPLKYLGEHLG
ncbi:hypothetical protein [Mycolicibacterium sp. S3B2]|uniref:hypothetical protein n=1 Tax=Mycolicibacterium sp. S3B2 TaxID=3415120 RepID=UPI003C7DB8A3